MSIRRGKHEHAERQAEGEVSEAERSGCSDVCVALHVPPAPQLNKIQLRLDNIQSTIMFLSSFRPSYRPSLTKQQKYVDLWVLSHCLRQRSKVNGEKVMP